MPVDGVVTRGPVRAGPAHADRRDDAEVFAPGSAVSAGKVNLTGPLAGARHRPRARDPAEPDGATWSGRRGEREEPLRLARRPGRGPLSPGVHILSDHGVFGWGLISGDRRLAVNIAAAVLIITCPCALGLAVPAVVTAASGRLFRQGMLIKDGKALERLAEVDTVLFDKTGTLTTGRPVLTNAEALPAETLALAAGLAEGTTIPCRARSSKAARRTDIRPTPLTDIGRIPASAPRRRATARPFASGAPNGSAHPRKATSRPRGFGRRGRPGALRFTDEPRPEAAEAVARLRAAGLPVALLSGDGDAPVRALAERLGIETWIARATPADKVAHLQTMRDAGHKPLMIGDGLNDAAALAAAHVSMSPASAVDASRSAADLILIGDRIDRAVNAGPFRAPREAASGRTSAWPSPTTS